MARLRAFALLPCSTHGHGWLCRTGVWQIAELDSPAVSLWDVRRMEERRACLRGGVRGASACVGAAWANVGRWLMAAE